MTTPNSNDLHRLDRWLRERRWYGDKTRTLTGADVVFHAKVTIGGDAVDIEVRRLAFASGEPADYLLMVDSEQPDVDGVESERVRRWLVGSFTDARTVDGLGGGSLRFAPGADQHVLEGLRGLDSRVFRGEQSNSSIVFGDKAMLKLFRKLREGINPEVEIGTFLTRHTEFTAFPKLYGTIDLIEAGRETTLGALQEFVPSVGDAWSWVTERVGDPGTREETIEAARQLGIRTGEMHRALASGADEAFAPELASGRYADRLRDEALSELRDTLRQLNQHGVGDTTTLGRALGASLDAMRELEGTMITRMHGDYHLGQVLRTADGDFAILDFEGEPSRSLAERRAKASPLRDVAGMLRSFDYAAETARRAGGNADVDIDGWYRRAREAYLAGYGSTVATEEALMRGWTAGSRERVRAAFEVHKALYEVRYELNNRPGWLEIPLNALRRIASVNGAG